MNYDYVSLYNMAKIDKMVGKWNGKPIYACSKKESPKCLRDTSRFYIVYDDGNALVRGGRNYGYVSIGGVVNEYTEPKWYLGAFEGSKREEKKNRTEEKKESVNDEIGLSEINSMVSELLLAAVDTSVGDS